MRQFAQGYGQVARGPFQSVGAGFKFFYVCARADGDCRERIFYLHD